MTYNQKLFMKKNPIKSYLNLNKILNFYLDWLEDDKQKNNSLEVKKIMKSDLVKVILGLFCVDKDVDDIGQLQANRYFMNALDVKSLPSPEMCNNFAAKNDIKEFYLSPNHNLGINNYENLKNLALNILNKFNSDVELIPVPDKKWGPEKKKYFEEHGYVIIHDVMTPSECDNYREIALNIAQEEKEQKLGFFYGYKNTFQRVYNLVNKSLDLGRLLTQPIVHQIMNDLFDRDTFHEKYLLCSYHLNIVPSQGQEQKFHLDAKVPDPLPPWLIRANLSYIVESHNDDNGALLVLPGSHKFLRQPHRSDEKIYNKDLIKLTAPKGSLIIWNGHLWHKSGENKTKKERTGLLACFSASHLLEVAMEENHALIIDSENSKYFSADLKRLLMFDHGIKEGARIKSKYFMPKKIIK